MNTNVHKTIGQITIARFALPALIAVLNLIPAGRVTAQTFTTRYSFTAASTNSSSVYTNSDGAEPFAGLILSGDTLYGTAEGGGTSGNGTVFAVNTDSTGFTNLHSFNGSDGANPQAGLISSGNTLYGTAHQGGSSDAGTVFAVHTDGTGFTNLYSFTYSSGGASYPEAGLTLPGNTLYGMAPDGGSSAYGTMFAVHTACLCFLCSLL